MKTELLNARGVDVMNKVEENPWGFFNRAFANKEILLAEIGGVESHPVEGKEEECFVFFLGKVKGFLPLSETTLGDPAGMINMLGARVYVQVEMADRGVEVAGGQRGLLLFSMKKAHERMAAATMPQLKVGDVRTGYVLRVTNHRAFVNLGGVEAILPKEEVAHQFVQTPKDHLHAGQVVRVKVLAVDAKTGEVKVSKKATEVDEWASFVRGLQTGKPYKGTIAGVTAPRNRNTPHFVQLPGGVTAMAPYSKKLVKDTQVAVTITAVREAERKVDCRIVRVFG